MMHASSVFKCLTSFRKVLRCSAICVAQLKVLFGNLSSVARYVTFLVSHCARERQFSKLQGLKTRHHSTFLLKKMVFQSSESVRKWQEEVSKIPFWINSVCTSVGQELLWWLFWEIAFQLQLYSVLLVKTVNFWHSLLFLDSDRCLKFLKHVWTRCFGSWLCFRLQACLYLKLGAELASKTLCFKAFYKF